jgi:hypothetical protein
VSFLFPFFGLKPEFRINYSHNHKKFRLAPVVGTVISHANLRLKQIAIFHVKDGYLFTPFGILLGNAAAVTIFSYEFL